MQHKTFKKDVKTHFVRVCHMTAQAVALLALLPLVASQAVLCPSAENPGFEKSISQQGKQASFSFKNDAGCDVSLWWIDFEGKELYRGVTGATEASGKLGTFPGHVFQVRAILDNRLLLSFRAGGGDDGHLVVGDCGLNEEIGEQIMDKSRWPEFEKYAAKSNEPCKGEHSGEWSCIRWATPEEITERDPSNYGFHADDAPMGRKAAQTIDWGYGQATQHKMLNVTEYDGGYMKMDMTDKMKECLYPWYQDRLKDSVTTHGELA
jgi:hypothetical protein